MKGISITAISDLHGYYPKLEGGDLLIVAGDFSKTGSYEDTVLFINWASDQKYEKVLFIGGNHDNDLVEYKPIKFSHIHVEYLCDSGTEFKGLRIWGSPWTRKFKGQNPKAMAFSLDTEEELEQKFRLIPKDVDILITHSPPFTVLDSTKRGEQVGSTALMAYHVCSDGFRPKLWVFGHIHEDYGQTGSYQWNETKYVNASHVNEHYDPVNSPIRIKL